MIPNKNAIFSLIRSNSQNIKALGVESIGLFGSYVRDGQHDDSDVDFLVKFRKDQKTFDNFMNLCFLLETLMEHEIELVTIESLSPYIAPYILHEVEYVDLSS